MGDLVREADSLFAQRAFFEASIAYERVLFRDTSRQATLYAANRKIECLKQQHRYGEAITFIKSNLNETLPDSVNYNFYYEEILCAFLGAGYENVLALAEQVKFAYPKFGPDTRILLFQVLSLNELQRWSEASNVYNVLLQSISIADTATSPYKTLPHLKSKDRAQWLSTFIPGGGQFYAGKPLEALATIVMQGAGIYFGVISFQQHYYVAAWLVGAGLFGSFHMGGVRRSEVLVEQYNQKKVHAFNQQVRSQLLELMDEHPAR